MNEQKPYDLRILYVEDEAVTREEIALFLARRSREVITATNGAEGLELFRREKPEIIVTDIRMPVMDGLKMARAIREESKGALMIVTTAHSDTQYMLQAIDIGVDHYVVKPVSVEKLERALDKCAEIVEYRRTQKSHFVEREKLIADLQKALAEIKTLHGILPICASCKRIRDDKGAWQQLEAYISEHTDSQFSHGLCQECAKRLYPEYYREEDHKTGH